MVTGEGLEKSGNDFGMSSKEAKREVDHIGMSDEEGRKLGDVLGMPGVKQCSRVMAPITWAMKTGCLVGKSRGRSVCWVCISGSQTMTLSGSGCVGQ